MIIVKKKLYFFYIFSTSVYCFYVGRFVGGMAVGALSVAVPPYVAELAQPSVRANLAHCSQLQLTAGILAGYFAGELIILMRDFE